MQPPQQPRPGGSAEGVEHLAAALPDRPKLITPGRVIMLFLALIGLYVVWPSLVATVCFMAGGFIMANFLLPVILQL